MSLIKSDKSLSASSVDMYISNDSIDHCSSPSFTDVNSSNKKKILLFPNLNQKIISKIRLLIMAHF